MNEGLCWYVAMSEWSALSVYGICDGGECHFLVGMWLYVHGVVSMCGVCGSSECGICGCLGCGGSVLSEYGMCGGDDCSVSGCVVCLNRVV